MDSQRDEEHFKIVQFHTTFIVTLDFAPQWHTICEMPLSWYESDSRYNFADLAFNLSCIGTFDSSNIAVFDN